MLEHHGHELPPEFALPPLASAAELINDCLDAALPREPITADAWAERTRSIKGARWDFDRVPYTRRPLWCASSGLYRTVAIQGPAQSAKSEVGRNFVGWVIECDPHNLIWLQSDYASVREEATTNLAPMIEETPELRRRRVTQDWQDHALRKNFRGDMWLLGAWPVAGQLQRRSAKYTIADDFDRAPQKVAEQDLRELLEGRQTVYEGAGAVSIYISSPELGDEQGIARIVTEGTRETFRLPCPQCGDYFEPDARRHLHYNGETPDEAAESAYVGCPSCGGVIEPRHKAEMLRRGVYASPHQTVRPDGQVEGPAVESSTASFVLDGLIAGYMTWGELARRLRRAELKLERSGDESALRGVYNTRLGRNYTSVRENMRKVEEHELAAHCGDYRQGTVPPGPAVLTAAVDVQGDRFEVRVWGWGVARECWLIDAYSIKQARVGVDIKPATHAEHWGVLLQEVFWRTYPVAGSDKEAPIYGVAIDTGGEPGVTEKAKAFYRTAREAGVPRDAIKLIKGGNKPKGRLLPPPTRFQTRDGKPDKRGPRLEVPNVNAWKDILIENLQRAEPGPGYLHLPADVSREHVREILAERRDAAGIWHKEGRANETLDLWVYGDVVRARASGERPDTAWVPAWARVPTAADAGQAVPAAAEEGAPAAPPASHPHARLARRPKLRRARSSLMNY